MIFVQLFQKIQIQIKFLLNGKASSFLTGDLASALQMIPADEIKSVEIITSPGAKYDGEGEAGIVNIITQKKVIDGYKASVDGSFGTRNNKNGFNLTLGKGRFSLSARGNAWYSWPREGNTTYLREDWNDNGDTNVLTNDGVSESQWIGYGSGINMYYDINAYNSISFYSSFLSLLNQKSTIFEKDAKKAPIIIFNKSLNWSSNSNVG